MRHSLAVSGRARVFGLALALLAAGSYLIPGQAAAQGTIVHIIPPQPLYYGPLLTSEDIDLNGDGVPDFNLSSPNGLDIDLTPLNNNAIISVPEMPPDSGAFIYALPAGATISSSLDPALVWWGTNGNGPPGIVSCANIGCIGYFQNGIDAYAGIRLELAGSLYYGWIQVQSYGVNAGQITDWAYETSPNTPIFAGDVPEPSTVALLVLAVAVAWLQRRRADVVQLR